MKRIIIPAFLALAGCVSALTYAKAFGAQTGANGSTQESVEVAVLSNPNVPVKFKKAKASRFNGKTVLTYAVTNETGEDLTKLHFVVFKIDRDNLIRGGEGWVLNTHLATQSSVEKPVTLELNIEKDERLVLAVWKTEGPTRTLSVEPEDVVQWVKKQVGIR